MPHDTNIPEDPTKEAELKNVLAQIKALETKPLAPPLTPDSPVLKINKEFQVPPAGGDVPSQNIPGTTTPTQASSSQASEPLPAAPQKSSICSFEIHEIVQVIEKESRYYGVLFQIGDAKDGQVHGYRIMESGGREYITAKINEIVAIGQSKVRLRTPCSPKWMAQHGG